MKFTPLEYLQMDIANNFKSKQSFEDRLSWFKENEDKLHYLVTKAEEPALYFAGVNALNQKETGYMISLDASCSGIQLMSVLTGDKTAAEFTNVSGSQIRDAYTEVFKAMGTKIEGITRKECKDAVMCACYGSISTPKEIFGEHYEVFEKTMAELFPEVWKLNKLFLDMWNPRATEYNWVMPDNFHCKVKVMGVTKERFTFKGQTHVLKKKENIPSDYGKSIGANTIHS